MSKILRKTAKLFGVTAAANQMAQAFGDFANATPIRTDGPTADPTLIQSLAIWSDGWFDAVDGVNSPAIEDMNAAFLVMFWQVAYLLQTGVPEWDTNTVYFIGSIAQDGQGNSYSCIFDNAGAGQSGNALTNITFWKSLNRAPTTSITSGPNTITLAENGTIFLVDTSGGSVEFDLPAASSVGSGFEFSIIDKTGFFSPANFAFLVPNGADLIIGLNANYDMKAPWGSWTFFTDGTSWFKL